MQKLASAILVLFVTSLVGGAFAAGCMAAPRASTTQVQELTPLCCAAQAACMGGSCFAPAGRSGCTSDAGSLAVAQKSQAPNDLVKAPAPVVFPAVSLTTIAHVCAIRTTPTKAWASIAGYSDIYARTGRLLI